MGLMEQYKDKVFASHPELVTEFLDADIAAAQAKVGEAQAEVDSLNEIKAEMSPAPIVPETQVAPEVPAEQAPQQ